MFNKDKCQKCGKGFSKSFDFCPHCGFSRKKAKPEDWGMLGDTDFIPESYQRFSINTIEDFGDMTNLSANSTIPNVIALNLGTGLDSSVTSYWRLQIPQLFDEAECQGSVVLVATLSS